MFREIEVFLGHEHSLTEEILVDLLAVGFWDKPWILSVSKSFEKEGSMYIVTSSWRCSGNRVQ